MPSVRIGSSSFLIPRFAAVGSKHGSVVRHIGLLNEATPLPTDAGATVMDVAPPLRIGQPQVGRTPLFGQFRPSVAGWFNLDEEQQAEVDVWLARVRKILPLGSLSQDESKLQYIALPHWRTDRDPVSGIVRLRRFSCVGFVVRCFAEAIGVDLVDIDNMPEISQGLLGSVWPAANDPRSFAAKDREAFGLNGDGPWRVLVPGYVFHSLSRANISTPYQPKIVDMVFPRIEWLFSWLCQPSDGQPSCSMLRDSAAYVHHMAAAHLGVCSRVGITGDSERAIDASVV